ncbi:hypothetical protein HMPREF1141_1399 [Clostridium sp. MSTE9]|nr:hypothetical protein HMPREF1141_1399 [Clostridium sp. MSTE9]
MVLSYKPFPSTWIKKQDQTRALRERKRNKKNSALLFFQRRILNIPSIAFHYKRTV